MIFVFFVTYSGCSGVSDDFGGVHGLREDLVQLRNELSIVDETWLGPAAVAID